MPGQLGFVQNNQPPRDVIKALKPKEQPVSDYRKSVSIDEVKPCEPGQKNCYKIVLKVKNKDKKKKTAPTPPAPPPSSSND